LQAAQEDAARIDHAGFNEALSTFTATADALIAADPAVAEAGSTPFLTLAGIVATGWIAARLIAAEAAILCRANWRRRGAMHWAILHRAQPWRRRRC
jgi:hypothetical protein